MSKYFLVWLSIILSLSSLFQADLPEQFNLPSELTRYMSTRLLEIVAEATPADAEIGNNDHISVFEFKKLMIYKFSYNYPSPGTADELIDDFGKQGLLLQFLVKEFEDIFGELPASTEVDLIYLPNTHFLSDRIGLRVFQFDGQRWRYVWQPDEERIQHIEAVFSAWIPQEKWRILRDNAITTKTGPASYYSTPLVSVWNAVFISEYTTQLPIIVFIEFPVMPTTQKPETWVFFFYTPPEDRAKSPYSLSTPGKILLNRYAKGQTIIFRFDGTLEDCINYILIGTLKRPLRPVWPANIRPK